MKQASFSKTDSGFHREVTEWLNRKNTVKITFGFILMFLPYWICKFLTGKYFGENTAIDVFVPYFILYCLGAPLLLISCRSIADFDFKSISRKPRPTDILIIFILQSSSGYFILAIASALFSMFGYKAVSGSFTSLPSYIASLVIAPVGEEFVFRWFLYGKLRNSGYRIALFYTSFLFAVAHLVSQGVPQAVYVFWLSLIWCCCREKYDSFLSNVLLHIGSNVWFGIIPLLLSGSKTLQFIYVIVNCMLLAVVVINHQIEGGRQ